MAMDLDVREVARLMNVSEKTVDRWARAGSIPAYRVHDQYRFNRVELQEWASRQGKKVSPDLFAPEDGAARPSLLDALRRGGIHRKVPGQTRDDVLREVVGLPGIPASVDRALLLDLLHRREALASTGIGAGIAIPHPRDPLVVHVEAPVVLLCFLRKGVDFQALDRQPVRVLFLLLSPTIEQHLQVLSRLAYLLHDDMLNQWLSERATDDAICDRIAKLEAALGRPMRRSAR